MKADEHVTPDIERATVGRIGRDVAGAGVVVLLLLPFVAISVVNASPILGTAALVLTVALGAALIAAGTSLRHGKHWAAVALSAAVPPLIAACIAILAYVLVLALGESVGGVERPSFVPWPVAAVIAVPGIPLWIVVSYTWSMRRTLRELLSGGPGADRVTAEKPRTSALAVASFVLSLPPLALCYTVFGRPFLLEAAIVALLLALVAQVQIRRSRGRLGGLGFARGAAVIYVLTVMMYPVFIKEMESAHKATCLAHSKELTIAMESYLKDHHGVYPPADSWSDALKPYVNADTFRCPHSKNKQCGLAFNGALGGRRAADIAADPARLVLFFESDAGWNAHGGPELLPAEPRHKGGDNVSFPDGHAKWLSRARHGDSSPPHWLRAYPPDAVVWDPDTRDEGEPSQN